MDDVDFGLHKKSTSTLSFSYGGSPVLRSILMFFIIIASENELENKHGVSFSL